MTIALLSSDIVLFRNALHATALVLVMDIRSGLKMKLLRAPFSEVIVVPDAMFPKTMLPVMEAQLVLVIVTGL
jgi:hypothetical protein